MAYPEKILATDEEVAEHLHPHWITLVRPVFWFLAICAAGGAGLAAVSNLDGTGHSILLVAIIVVGVVLLCWLSLAPWVRWRTTHYVFTTHRVLIRRGAFHHMGRDISLQRINDVGFSQTLWDRIVKAGTLSIESAGENGQETLHDIPNSEAMQQTLNQLIEQDAERRARQAYGGGQPGYPQPGYQQGYPQGYQQGPPPGYPPDYPQGPPSGYPQGPPPQP